MTEEKEITLYRKYGITEEQYTRLLNEQGGRCAICCNLPGGHEISGRLYIDHDHKTNTIKELLCRQCNIGIGYFEDNPNFLRRAFDYVDVESEIERSVLEHEKMGSFELLDVYQVSVLNQDPDEFFSGI